MCGKQPWSFPIFHRVKELNCNSKSSAGAKAQEPVNCSSEEVSTSWVLKPRVINVDDFYIVYDLVLFVVGECWYQRVWCHNPSGRAGGESLCWTSGIVFLNPALLLAFIQKSRQAKSHFAETRLHKIMETLGNACAHFSVKWEKE